MSTTPGTIEIANEKFVEELKKNRAAYVAEHQKAMELYSAKLEQQLLKRLSLIKKGKTEKVKLTIDIPRPEDHTQDYDLQIARGEFNYNPSVVLTESEFARYVLDQWPWKKAEQATLMHYTTGAKVADNFGCPVGLQGPQGSQGVYGVQGLQGPQGFSGGQGVQGPQEPAELTVQAASIDALLDDLDDVEQE